HVDNFVTAIARDEKDKTKWRKLEALRLTSDEWERADLFTQLLAHADERQHAFSSETHPCLQYAIPALEGLYKAWSTRAAKDRYSHFSNALHAGADKIAEYYDKMGDSKAYIISMYLAPDAKGSHFEKHWDVGLQKEAEALMEQVFSERYTKLNAASMQSAATATSSKPGASLKPQTSKRVLSDDESDDDKTQLGSDSTSASKPWYAEYCRYLQTREDIPPGVSHVQWWGRNAYRYPTWASLALDYLPIMAMSVSSERAFSQGGITISKRRNRLKGDIVEGLQCLKCAIQRDLLFKEHGPCSAQEDESLLDAADDSVDTTTNDGELVEGDESKEGGEHSWDEILEDDDNIYEDLSTESPVTTTASTQ
ncbi:uncharacterized protein PHACADRAFT_109346, partial [Phanerochaete carnosa HHB-10118-sp]